MKTLIVGVEGPTPEANITSTIEVSDLFHKWIKKNPYGSVPKEDVPEEFKEEFKSLDKKILNMWKDTRENL